MKQAINDDFLWVVQVGTVESQQHMVYQNGAHVVLFANLQIIMMFRSMERLRHLLFPYVLY